MIESVSVRKNKIFVLSDKRTFEFKPGLNLILGPNASGKTSLLTAIKYHCYYEDEWGFSGHRFSIKEGFDDRLKSFPAKVTGNISKVFLYRPEELKENTNLSYSEVSTFRMIQSRFESNGEARYNYHDEFVKRINNNKNWTADEVTLAKSNDINIDNNIILIFDEPENCMAINMQFGLFDWLYEFVKQSSRVQIIIATHSIAAFSLVGKDKVNTIEMTKGWTQKIIDETKKRLYE